MTSSHSIEHVPRVSKLDAYQLEQEVHNILKLQFKDCFKYLNPYFLTKYEAEIDAIFKVIILKFTVFSNNASLGQRILNLKYQSNLTRYACITYGIIQVLAPWIHSRAMNNLKNLKSHQILKQLNDFYNFFSLLNFFTFLVQGNYPTLRDRILKLSIVPAGTNQIRLVSFEYMNRELLWNGILDFIKGLLSALNLRKIYHLIGLSESQLKRRVEAPNGCCNSCLKPYVMPHHVGCNHPYCYYCIMNEVLDNEDFKCFVCEHHCSNVSSIQTVLTRRMFLP